MNTWVFCHCSFKITLQAKKHSDILFLSGIASCDEITQKATLSKHRNHTKYGTRTISTTGSTRPLILQMMPREEIARVAIRFFSLSNDTPFYEGKRFVLRVVPGDNDGEESWGLNPTRDCFSNSINILLKCWNNASKHK